MKTLAIWLGLLVWGGGWAWGQGVVADTLRARQLLAEADSLKSYREFQAAAFKAQEAARIYEDVLGLGHWRTFNAWHKTLIYCEPLTTNYLYQLSFIKSIKSLIILDALAYKSDTVTDICSKLWYQMKIGHSSDMELAIKLARIFEVYHSSFLNTHDAVLLYNSLLHYYKLSDELNRRFPKHDSLSRATACKGGMDTLKNRLLGENQSETRTEQDFFNLKALRIILLLSDKKYESLLPELEAMHQFDRNNPQSACKYMAARLTIANELIKNSQILSPRSAGLPQPGRGDSLAMSFYNVCLDKLLQIHNMRQSHHFEKIYYSEDYHLALIYALAIDHLLTRSGASKNENNFRIDEIRNIYISFLKYKLIDVYGLMAENRNKGNFTSSVDPNFFKVYLKKDFDSFLNLISYIGLKNEINVQLRKYYIGQSAAWAPKVAIGNEAKSSTMNLKLLIALEDLMCLINNQCEKSKVQQLAEKLDAIEPFYADQINASFGTALKERSKFKARIESLINPSELRQYVFAYLEKSKIDNLVLLHSGYLTGDNYSVVLHFSKKYGIRPVEAELACFCGQKDRHEASVYNSSFISLKELATETAKNLYFDSFFSIDKGYFSKIRPLVSAANSPTHLALSSAGVNITHAFNHNTFLTDTSCLRQVRNLEFDENFWQHPTVKNCFSRKTLAYQNMPVYLSTLVDREVVQELLGIKPEHHSSPNPATLAVHLISPLRSTVQYATIDRPKTFREFGDTDFFRLVDDTTTAYELHFVSDEFRNIERSLVNLPARIITDSSLYREQLIEALCKPTDILHVASHSWKDRKSYSNFYLLARPRAGTVLWDNLISEYEIGDLPIKAKLVVLSSCESADFVPSQTVGGRGLASAFVRAGAQMVVGCRWRVDDRAAAEFMKHFYTDLARDFDPGLPVERVRQAVQYAIRQLVDSDEFCHPFYWAGWQLLVN